MMEVHLVQGTVVGRWTGLPKRLQISRVPRDIICFIPAICKLAPGGTVNRIPCNMNSKAKGLQKTLPTQKAAIDHNPPSHPSDSSTTSPG
jgi:hypothetical protein